IGSTRLAKRSCAKCAESSDSQRMERKQKWFLMNDEEWPTWKEFRRSFEAFFLPKGYFEKLSDQVKQRKQQRGEPFKEYMVDLQNCMPRMKMFMRPYACASLEEVMGLAEEFEELALEEEVFNRQTP
ncbi:hypothetical protein KR067_006282, partial [Drosophila pandora]